MVAWHTCFSIFHGLPIKLKFDIINNKVVCPIGNEVADLAWIFYQQVCRYQSINLPNKYYTYHYICIGI